MASSQYVGDISCYSIGLQNSISQIRVHCKLCGLSSHFGLQVIEARMKDLRHHGSDGAALAAGRAPNQLAGGVVVEYKVSKLCIENK